jgi:arylsulfatase A-like enzyme
MLKRSLRSWHISKGNHARLILGLVGSLIWTGCQQKVPSKNQAAVFRLFDLFQPEDLTGKVTPEDAGWKRLEWPAQHMAPWNPPPKTDDETLKPATTPMPAIGFRALSDLAELKIEQGRLTGAVTGPAPVLHFALKENRGGAESVKFIEVRMNVSGAKQVWLRPEAGASVDDSALVGWAQANSWNPSVEVEENKLHIYRFKIPSNRGPRGRGAGDLRHFSIAFRECNSAKFSIESVRLVSEREERLKEPSGQQWAGLAEIYRATLAAKTPETIRIPVRELPERARLDFAIGTKEDVPVKFKVTISNRGNSKESSSAVVFERTVTIPNRWQTARIDLAAYTGKSVVVEFALEGERRGLLGYWGSPTIRSLNGSARSTSATNRPKTPRKPRGVIFLVVDTLRKDHLNIYGYPRETLVHLKKFAEDGVAFSHAISQGTMTKISIPSMVTSLYPLSHTVLKSDKALPASATTIAELFREEGYATVAYSSVPFTGKSNNMHQGYDELHEKGSIADSEYKSKTARHYVDRLITWLKEHRDEPFFVFLHVFDPHPPFRPPPPYDTLWGAPGSKDRLAELEADMRKNNVPMPMGLPRKQDYLKTGNNPDELLKIYLDWYDGSIRGVDAEIGRLLEALKETGLDQDTLMVFSSDHGEEFWEHGRLYHGHSVYGELNQVPLVFRWPNNADLRKGAMIDKQIENIDIMPTILELAGIQGPTSMQGRSLVPLLNGSGIATWQERPALTQAMVVPDPPLGGRPQPHFGIIDHGWKLVSKEVDPKALQELYEHPIDSLNFTNVIKTEAAASHVKALTETLEAWKSRARTAQLPSDDTTMAQLSSEELRLLRALGYVGGGTSARPATSNTGNASAHTATNTNKDAPDRVAVGADKKEGGP